MNTYVRIFALMILFTIGSLAYGQVDKDAQFDKMSQELKLTEKQKSDLKTWKEESKLSRQKLGDENRKKMRALHDESDKKLRSILDEKQYYNFKDKQKKNAKKHMKKMYKNRNHGKRSKGDRGGEKHGGRGEANPKEIERG